MQFSAFVLQANVSFIFIKGEEKAIIQRGEI